MHNDEIIELTDIVEEGAPITSNLGDFPAEHAVDPKNLDDELDALLEDISPELDPLTEFTAPPESVPTAEPTATEVLAKEPPSFVPPADTPSADDSLDIFANAPLEPETASLASPGPGADSLPSEASFAEERTTPDEADLLTEPDLGNDAPPTAFAAELLAEPDLTAMAEPTPTKATAPQVSPAPQELDELLATPLVVPATASLPQDPESLPFSPALMEQVTSHIHSRLQEALEGIRHDLLTELTDHLRTATEDLRQELGAGGGPHSPAVSPEELASIREALAAQADRIQALATQWDAPKAASSATASGAGGIFLQEAAALREAMAAQTAEMEALRALIAAKDAEMVALKQQLAARDAQLTAITARLDAVTNQLEAMDANIEARLQSVVEEAAPRVAARAIREELAQMLAENGQ